MKKEGRPAEAVVPEGEAGGVTVDHLDVRAREALNQSGSKFRVDLDGSQPIDSLAQYISRRPIAGADLEEVRSKFD